MTSAVSVSRCTHGPAPTDGLPYVNGVRLEPLAPAELPAKIEEFLECPRSHVVHFIPAHPTVLARRDLEYRAVLNDGDLNLVDGVSVALALRLFGFRAPRTTGSDALELLPRVGLKMGIKHYMFGGTPEVVERLCGRLRQIHPGIEIVGAEAPPFRNLTDDELEAAAERMRAAGADLVWVGLGSPKQDGVAEALRAFEAAPVLLCIGAAFDFVSGAKARAPGWVRAIGMEWLFRLLTEPRRLWRRYLIGNIQFVAGVSADHFRHVLANRS